MESASSVRSPAVIRSRAMVAGAVGDGPGDRGWARNSAADQPRSTLADAVLRHGSTRRREHVGDLTADIRYCPRQQQADLRVGPGKPIFLLPLEGSVEIITESRSISCTVGRPAIMSREEAATAIWSESACGLILHLRRERIQAVASRQLGDARRLAGVNLPIEPQATDQNLEAIVARMIDTISRRTATLTAKGQAIEAEFYEALVGRLAAREDSAATFPIVRSVTQAMRHIHAHHQQPCDAESLASVTGVTALTLRKGFRSSLGTTVTQYVQAVRLDWAHERLSGNGESRSIQALGIAAGFKDGSSFSRAYLRRFGEAPSETRVRAVKTVG